MPEELLDLAPGPELGAWLEEHREPLLRRWLSLLVERSSLEELAARPLGERVRELDLLLDVARSGARRPEELISERVAAGGPFTLALLHVDSGASAWAAELAAESSAVHLSDRELVVIVESVDAPEARLQADRLRIGAWQRLGADRPLPGMRLAHHPADGADAVTLLAVAGGRAGTAQPAAASQPTGTHAGAASDLWAELATNEVAEAGERPPAPVTPLRPA